MTPDDCDDYLDGIKDRVFRWLAGRSLHEEKPEFKIFDVKTQFETITMALLERTVASLVEEGKVVVPEGRARIVVYTVDRGHALLAAPPPPPLPTSAKKSSKRSSCEGKENSDGGGGNDAGPGGGLPRAKHAKTAAGLQERQKNAPSSSSSSSSSSSLDVPRAVSPFRGSDDGSKRSASDDDTSAKAVPVYVPSPPVTFRLREEPSTFLARDQLELMMAVLFEAFEANGGGLISKDALKAALTARMGPPFSESDFDEFMRHMSEENKVMVEGDDVYEI